MTRRLPTQAALQPSTDERTAGPYRFFYLSLFLAAASSLGLLLAAVAHSSEAPTAGARDAVAALDNEYQAAVKRNDATTMSRILADDFVLVTGSGKSYNKADLLADARSGETSYQKNEEAVQTVRVWEDTAVVTARLWEKGVSNGKPFDHTFWFSDTYVHTRDGWKYVFGQSSLPLPNSSPE